jgi:hypothetical protein
MKKNPLNDLDQFLQQEAHSIVPPTSLSDKLKQEASHAAVSPEEQLMAWANQNPEKFYDTLIAVGEKMNTSKNTMLINTALYLKSGNSWKEAVLAYWGKKE